MQPSEKTSARASTCRLALACSGAMYAGVPTATPLRVRLRATSSSRARPKSSTFGRFEVAVDEHHVGRLEIAVDDAPPVGRGDGVREAQAEPDRLLGREPRVTEVDVEALAADPFHREEQLAGGVFAMGDVPDDPVVTKLGERRRLPQETLAPARRRARDP